MDEKLIELFSQLLAGCEVPRSLGVLGKAEKPFDDLYSELHLFGYPTPALIELRIRERLS